MNFSYRLFLPYCRREVVCRLTHATDHFKYTGVSGRHGYGDRTRLAIAIAQTAASHHTQEHVAESSGCAMSKVSDLKAAS